MFQVRGGIQQGCHFFQAQDRGQLTRDLWPGNVFDKPILFQRLRVEEPESGGAHLQSGRSQFSFVQQMELICTNLFRSQLVWWPVEVPCEIRHGLRVGTDRERRVVPQLQIFDHSLA